MATNHPDADTDGVSLDYGHIFGFWKESWFRGWLIVEIILFGGGYLLAQQGTLEGQDALAGAAPDVHLSLGGIMGAIGIVFGFCLVVTVGVSIWFRLQKELEPDVSF